MRIVTGRFVLALFAALAVAAHSAAAQPTPKQPAETEAPEATELPTKEELAQRLAAVAQSSLDENQRQRAAGLYQQAVQSLTEIEKLFAEKVKWDGYRQRRDKNIVDEKAALATPVPEPSPPASNELTALEEALYAQEQALNEKREDHAWYETEPRRRAARLAEIPRQLGELRTQLAKVQEQLAAPVAESQNELVGAERAALQTKEVELKATIDAIEAEQQHKGLGLDLIHLTRDRMARELGVMEKQVETLRDEIRERRQTKANQRAVIAANAAQIRRPTALAKLAEQNSTYANKIKELEQEKAEIDKRLAITSESLDTVEQDYKRSRGEDDNEDLSEASGQLLRQQQEKLPSTTEIERWIALRRPQLEEAKIASYLLDGEQSRLADIDEAVSAVLAEAPAGEREMIAAEARNLLETQKQYMSELAKLYSEYITKLAELTAKEEQLVVKTNEFADFIAERVFWIRSCQVLQPTQIRPSLDAASWSLSPYNWRAALEALRQAGQRAPLQLTVFVLAFPILMLAQRRSRRLLREIGEQAARRDSTQFRLTLQALWLTLVLALPWPTLLWFVGWCLDSPLNDSKFVSSLSVSLRFTAYCLLLVELWRHVCRPKGLADAHFDWPSTALSQLRRNLRWLAILGTPLVLWAVGLEVQQQEKLWNESLGRVLFITVMLLLALVLWRVLLVEGSPFRQFVQRKPDNWLEPLHNLWCPLVVAAPVMLAIAAFAGYYYTALQLALRGIYTIALVLGVLVVGGLLERWMLVNRRKLAREQARQRRAQAAAAATASAEGAVLAVEPLEENVDLATVSEQTHKLIRTLLFVTAGVSLWYLWREMLPAVAFIFDAPIPPATETPTWADLLVTLLVLAFTWIGVRNLPGLLELAVLQHLPLDAGARYAVSTITRYVLMTVGILIAAAKIGIEWGSIQWLVAAMGVGLGFGLQEIFANFISGIILLFERPIRVGDIVTLGDKSGVVNRIRMRSTTIVDWDRKEYIVPNKDLVTERLLNWTLSDQVNRIEIRVGVAYGSDTDRACALLLEAAREQPDVLADPPPHAIFDGFGDSALNLVMRCYLPTLEKRLEMIHILHTSIDRKFRAAGLEISFPQRDLWIRSVPGNLLQHVNGKNGFGHSHEGGLAKGVPKRV